MRSRLDVRFHLRQLNCRGFPLNVLNLLQGSLRGCLEPVIVLHHKTVHTIKKKIRKCSV